MPIMILNVHSIKITICKSKFVFILKVLKNKKTKRWY